MFAVLLASAAIAGEIQVEGGDAMFAVNGRLIEPAEAGLRTPPLAAGVHRLDARNRSGELISAIDLTVDDEPFSKRRADFGANLGIFGGRPGLLVSVDVKQPVSAEKRSDRALA